MDARRTARLGPDDVRARAGYGGSVDALMLNLLPWAAELADPPISRFRVGAVVRGLSGALYGGGNREFAGVPLAFSIHAEQAAVANARLHGERGLTAIATSAPPCGFCRQFLTELAGAQTLRVLVPGVPPMRLGELLPHAFGPQDLRVAAGLLATPRRPLALAAPATDPLLAAALEAAADSYAPYSGTAAGAALLAADGAVFRGSYAENAAFNPSLAPLAVALVALTAAGYGYHEIARAALVETAGPISQRAAAELLLAAVSPVPLIFGLAATSQVPGGFNSTDTPALS